MPFSNLNSILSAIEKEIDIHLHARTPLAKKISEYVLKSGGKRLRPLLFVLSARLCGYETGFEIKLSPIFEYLHVATLVHDDVIDNAHLRRGKPAANVIWGNTVAILTGDFLLASALELAASSGNLEMVKILSQTTSLLAQGEILEIVKSNSLDLTEEEYLEIITGKTAVLMAAACRLGAVLAGADKEKEKALETYGHNLGLAFQIIDDVLDYIGSEKEFGKPIGHDLKEGKVTLPLIYALNQASFQEKEKMKELFDRRREDDIAALIAFVKEKQGDDLAIKKAYSFIEKAKCALEVFPDDSQKQILMEIADFVIKRRF